MAIIGIDLGTTNCLVAEYDGVGKPKIVHNSDGANITPSAVYLEVGSKNPIVGAQARGEIAVQPENVAIEFKRLMGTNEELNIGGINFNPTQLSALLLKKIRKDYEAAVGSPVSVVVTVPANFTNEAREATLAAIADAGIQTEHLLNEPTAAALYYANAKGVALDGTYLVFDLGGGTFDVTAISVKGEDIEVLGSEGVARLGGKDFDLKVTEVLAKKFEEKFSKKFVASDVDWNQEKAEDVKKALSQVEEKKVRLVGSDIPPTTFSITRSEFEEAISGLIAQAELQVESLLSETGLGVSDIKEVFLAGGSSRIPLVKRVLTSFFGKEPLVLGNPDEAIALGAAIYAAYKADRGRLNPLQQEKIGGLKFQEVAPHYFGTIYHDSELGKIQNDVLIEKNVPIPSSCTRSYQTIADGQTTIQCRITQSPQPESDPRFVRIIWEGDLKLPPDRPAGQQIKITFSYKENGTMDASFLDVASDRKTEINISSFSSDSKTKLNLDDFLVN